MKKSYPNTVLSTKVCNFPDCTKRLKKRLVEAKEPHNIQFCYKHDRILRGKRIKIKGDENESKLG